MNVNSKNEKDAPVANAQVFAAAAKTDQARTLFNDAARMVRPSPLLGDRLTPSGVNLGHELGKQPRDIKSGRFVDLSAATRSSGTARASVLMGGPNERPGVGVSKLWAVRTDGPAPKVTSEYVKIETGGEMTAWPADAVERRSLDQLGGGRG